MDGNGRISRLLSRRLLTWVGYGVGRYASLEGLDYEGEGLVYEGRDAYYDALAASTTGRQHTTHDPWPWLGSLSRWPAEAYETVAKQPITVLG